MPKKCEECRKKVASFGVEGSKKATHCGTCNEKRELGFVNVRSKKCQRCKKAQAHFGVEGGVTATHCAKCNEEYGLGLVDVHSKKCERCKKAQAHFGVEGSKQATHCGKCNEKWELGLINIHSKKCERCKKAVASYGVEGSKKATHCASCNEEYGLGLVDVVSKKCEMCKKVKACFGPEGGRMVTHCASCNEKWGLGYVNILSKKCERCKKSRATFGSEGSKKATHCASCNEEYGLGLVDVVSKKCERCEKTKASYGVEGSKEVTHCGTCNEKYGLGLVNIHCRKCQRCGKRAHYGKLFQPVAHCAIHKEPGELRCTKTHPKCSFGGCTDRPLYTSRPDGYPERCQAHCTKEDNKCESLKCRTCGMPDLLDPESGLCGPCSVHAQVSFGSSDPKPTWQKVKENEVEAMFDEAEMEYTIRDAIVPYGCSKFRPDFAFESRDGGLMIVVEVDESQHKYKYIPSCKLPRMVQIHNDFGGPGVIFLRYNPDPYLDAEGVRRKLSERDKQRLLDTVRKLQRADPFEGMVVCHMYFDGWDGELEYNLIDYLNPEDQKTTEWHPSFSS